MSAEKALFCMSAHVTARTIKAGKAVDIQKKRRGLSQVAEQSF